MRKIYKYFKMILINCTDKLKDRQMHKCLQVLTHSFDARQNDFKKIRVGVRRYFRVGNNKLFNLAMKMKIEE